MWRRSPRLSRRHPKRTLRSERLEHRLALAVLFVNDDAWGAKDGTSWPDAFDDLQDALAAAASGDQIWIAEGTYYPTQTPDQNATFRLPDGVDLYGGFAGGETSLDDRDPLARPATLSGNIGDDHNFFDNSFHVVTVDPGVSARLDGLQVRLGFAFGPDEASRRGGAIVNHGNLTLARTVLNSNQATNQGGNIYNTGELLVIGSQLELGGATEGGGIYNAGELTVLGSSITFNSAREGRGGGVFNRGSFTAINATISNNEATHGAGLYHESGASSLSHTTISHNTVRDWNNGGGGIYTDAGGVAISHTLVANNYQWHPFEPISVPNDVHGAFDPAGEYNLVGISDAATGLADGVNGNQIGTVENPIDARLTEEADYDGHLTAYVSLLPDSPAIDAGDPSFDPTSFTPPLFLDELGHPRVSPGTFDTTARIDIGAVESLPLHLVVTVVEDEVDGDNSAGDLSLREAIILANDNAGPNLIDVPAGHFLLQRSSDEDCDSTNNALDELKVRGRVATTIRGAGMGQTVIDAAGQHRVMWAFGAVVLEGMTLQNGNAESCSNRGGGGIHLNDGGELVLRRVELRHNQTQGAGGALSLDEESRAQIIDSEIWDNTAAAADVAGNPSVGGGVYSNADELKFENSNLHDNQADYGGAVAVTSSAVTMNQTRVHHNTAAVNGGGVAILSGALDLTESEITDNVAESFGGGIYAPSDVRVSESLIARNLADSGGGIWKGPDNPLLLTDSRVTDNRSFNSGGGLFNDGATVSITGGEFRGNQASDDGGGLFTIAGDVTVTDTQFIANGSSDNGGAIRSREGILTLNGVIVRGNSTDDTGGGLYATDATVTIDNSQFLENTTDDRDGGGIAIERGTLTLRNSSIRHNRAGLETDVDGRGGGLWAEEATEIQLIDSDISQNWAAFYGGGLHVEATGQLTIQRSRVAENVTRYAGGGLFATAQVAIESSTIEGNRAEEGGGLYAYGGGSLVNIRNSTFNDNQASAGGAIFLAGAPAEIVQSTISGNSATSAGGGLYLDESPMGRVAIRHSTITNNVATLAGGLRQNRTSAILSNSILAGNRATLDLWRETSDLINSLSPDSEYSLIGIANAEMVGGGTAMQFGTVKQPLDPHLGPLEYNGGPTQTHAPLPISPVIDAGDPAFNPAVSTPPLAADQRGQRRVVDGNGDLISRIDIGAVEFSPFFMFADITEDGRVDLLDLVLLQSNLGDTTAEYLQGDLNADGRIDQTDAAILLENFGRVMPMPPPPASPQAALASASSATRRARLHATATRRILAPPAVDHVLTDAPAAITDSTRLRASRSPATTPRSPSQMGPA